MLYCVSDIHGELDKFEQLLTLIRFSEKRPSVYHRRRYRPMRHGCRHPAAGHGYAQHDHAAG